MKQIYPAVLLLLMMLFSTVVFSQNNTSSAKLSAVFPESVSISSSSLNNILESASGQKINIALAENFMLNGTVVNKVKKYGNLENIIIRSTAWENALIQISRYESKAGEIIFSGRIMNITESESYVLVKDKDNNYSLHKKTTTALFQDCSL